MIEYKREEEEERSSKFGQKEFNGGSRYGKRAQGICAEELKERNQYNKYRGKREDD